MYPHLLSPRPPIIDKMIRGGQRLTNSSLPISDIILRASPVLVFFHFQFRRSLFLREANVEISKLSHNENREGIHSLAYIHYLISLRSLTQRMVTAFSANSEKLL